MNRKTENETKSWFFAKSNRINKPSARLIKKKEKSLKLLNLVRKWDITIDFTEIKKIRVL